MSLEELRKNWEAIEDSTNQNVIPNEQIEAMLKSKYHSFIRKVLIFDLLLLFICLYFMGLIIFRFEALEIIYLEILAIISIAMLAGLFVIRVIKLINVYRNRFLNNAPSIALKKLSKQKIRLQKFYLLNIVLGFLLMIILTVLTIKIYNEYDLIQSRLFWLVSIPSSLLFMVLINQWIRKNYVSVLREAADLLQELE